MWNVECGMWNGEWGMGNVKCEMWKGECERWKGEWLIGIEEFEMINGGGCFLNKLGKFTLYYISWLWLIYKILN